jgi:hypothetical protein
VIGERIADGGGVKKVVLDTPFHRENSPFIRRFHQDTEPSPVFLNPIGRDGILQNTERDKAPSSVSPRLI